MFGKLAGLAKGAWANKGTAANVGLGALNVAGNAYLLKDLFGDGGSSRDARRADAFEFEAGMLGEDAMRTTGALMDEEMFSDLLDSASGPSSYGSLGPLGDAANMARLEGAVQSQRNMLGQVAATLNHNALEAALDRIGL